MQKRKTAIAAFNAYLTKIKYQPSDFYQLSAAQLLQFQEVTGKTCIGKLSELSEFWRQIAEQLFCDRFRVVFGANSTNSTVFLAIHTKSKILICL